MPTISHKQRPNIANTTVGSTAGFAMMVGAVSVNKLRCSDYVHRLMRINVRNCTTNYVIITRLV